MIRIARKLNHPVKTLLFDLDDTLYPRSCGLMKKIGEQIKHYTMEQFNLPAEDSDIMRKFYKDKYGASLVGYVHVDKVDPKDFEAFVYNIDYSEYLTPDDRLIRFFEDSAYQKIIYTNGARVHAESVLRAMGIPRDTLSHIIALEDTKYYAKPMPESYQRMFALTGIDPATTVFFDDQERNLIAAQQQGIAGTVLVGSEKSSSVTLCVDELAELLVQ